MESLVPVNKYISSELKYIDNVLLILKNNLFFTYYLTRFKKMIRLANGA